MSELTVLPNHEDLDSASQEVLPHSAEEQAAIGQELAAVAVEHVIQTGIQQIENYANGGHANEQADSHSLDIEAAHSAAIDEDINRVFDQAQRENEMFDAHTAATQEDIARIYDEAHEENKAIDEQRKNVGATAADTSDENLKDNAITDTIPSAKTQPAGIENRLQEAASSDQEIAGLLKASGFTDGVPAGAEVTRDYAHNALIVASPLNKDVEIIKFLPGGGSQVTSYKFDEKAGVLKITTNGSEQLLAHTDTYTELDQTVAGDSIELPPAVAKAVGFERAILLG